MALLRRDALTWSNSIDESFNKLKSAMTTTLTLALLYFSQLFVIESDTTLNWSVSNAIELIHHFYQ
jgi:hypothetical protein